MNDSLKYLYEVPAVINPDHIRDALYDLKLRLQQEKSGKARRYYLDTFDWRIYRDGGVLTGVEYNDNTRLTWRELASGQIRYRHTVPGIPQFKESLSGKYLAGRMGAVLDMRTLYPRATVTCNVIQLKVLDREQKTVLHIKVQRDSSASVDGKRTPLQQTRLEIVPVRGYENRARKVGQLLENVLHAVPMSEDPILVVIRKGFKSLFRNTTSEKAAA